MNHWQRAIETHSANHGHMDHRCEDINKIDMRSLPRTRGLWGSPICTEATPANGLGQKRRPKGQLDLLEQDGHVEQKGFERTRATFHDIIRAAEYHRYEWVIVENVVDVAYRWELFDWWIQGMKILGYNCQFVSVTSAHIGGPDNPYAPQWRDRLYMVFTRVGIPLPDVSPTPLSWCPVCEALVDGVQVWKKPDQRKIGKYGRQYVYRCPRIECRHAIVEPLVNPAVNAIDWNDLGTPIGERPKTKSKPEGLAPSTMARIRAGRSLIGHPVMIIQAGANTYERPGSGYVRAWPVDQPLNSRTATAGDAVVSDPFLTLLRSGRIRNYSIGDPLQTIVTSGSNHGLVVPVGGNNHDAPVRPLADPFCTRVVRDTDGIVIPPFYVKNFGGNCRPEDTVGAISIPFGTITGKDHHALVVPYRGKRSHTTTTDEPFHTMATRDSAALVSPDMLTDDVSEWLFRMLKPREHLRAQRFWEDYIVKGNAGEQTMQAGNAVSVNVAHWLGSRVLAVL